MQIICLFYSHTQAKRTRETKANERAPNYKGQFPSCTFWSHFQAINSRLVAFSSCKFWWHPSLQYVQCSELQRLRWIPQAICQIVLSAPVCIFLANFQRCLQIWFSNFESLPNFLYCSTYIFPLFQIKHSSSNIKDNLIQGKRSLTICGPDVYSRRQAHRWSGTFCPE